MVLRWEIWWSSFSRKLTFHFPSPPGLRLERDWLAYQRLERDWGLRFLTYILSIGLISVPCHPLVELSDISTDWYLPESLINTTKNARFCEAYLSVRGWNWTHYFPLGNEWLCFPMLLTTFWVMSLLPLILRFVVVVVIFTGMIGI